MSDAFSHEGKVLGWIHSYTGDSICRFNIVMEGINALEKMCRLSDAEILEVDGMPLMNYENFKNEILGKTKRIYLSTNEYLLDRS